jgi:hypothetical protein
LRKIARLPGFRPDSNFGGLAVEALWNETLDVALDFRKFPRQALKNWILNEVASQYPNCSKLLSKESCGGCIENMLHVTNKQYLFVDENGALKEVQLHSFDDLRPFLGVFIILPVSVLSYASLQEFPSL